MCSVVELYFNLNINSCISESLYLFSYYGIYILFHYCSQNQFLQGDLSTQITRDLLHEAYNTPMTFADDVDVEEDEVQFVSANILQIFTTEVEYFVQ